MREKAVNNPPAGPDLTTELFDQFVQAGTFRNILTTFRELCDHLELKPATDRNFYHHLKSKITSWKAKHIWTKLDKRAMRKEYKKGKACANTRVLVIGAGPCGLRTAIECSFLGAKTVIIEKRDSFSRNNVLHLWPFLINDLRNLGAKKFFGKFCAGAIDHISIRQLQCILTKVALILGVEIHNCVTYEGLEEPPEDQQDGIGWRAKISPKDHPVYEYEFDVLAGADGSRNALTGFKRKEFRGKLAIAITANFINKHSQAEAMVEEISGVAFIFNQKFFQDLKKETGIDLENIVYYKDDTHYFVMTAKKQSLLAKGVILQDHNDVELLLSHKNVSQEKLQAYARGAAKFSTNNQLPHLDFAINHYGRSDVAMFDFTSLFQAEYAARIIDRNGHRLLLALVGDSLLEPFWPTGSGCARGFLGCFDAAWMIRSWAAGIMNPLEVLAERESIYRLLAQTTPENLAKDYDRYGITPTTRYPHVVTTTVKPHEVLHLYDTKDPDIKKRFELGSQPAATSVQLNRQTSIVRSSKLLFWCQRVTDTYTNVNIQNFTTSWKNGLALCAIIHRYRPDLIDFDSLQPQHVATNNQLAFDIAEKEFGIPPAMTGTDMANHVVPDRLTMTYYVSRFYDLFKDELPPVLRTQDFYSLPPILDENEDTAEPSHAVHSSPVPKASFLSRLTSKMRSKKTPTQLEKSENKENLAEIKEEKIEKEREKKTSHWSNIMSTKKHKSKDIIEIGDMDHRKSKLMDKQEKVVGLSYQKKFDEKDELDVGVRGANRVSGLAQQLQANLENSWGTGTGGKPASCTQEKPIKSKPYEPKIPITTSGQCFFCNRRVYVMERLSAEGLFFHRECFRCQHCNCMLRLGNYSFASGEHGKPGRFFCRPHYYLWGNNPATQHLAKKRPISTEVNQMPPVPIITQRPPSIISIPEDKPISPTSPNMLPDKDLLLTEPLNKKYRATPERIELENMRENISAGNVEMTEEELAKYNLGNYSTESSDSDDSDSEEIVTTRRKKSRRLHSEDEEDGDEEDDDEEYEEEDEGDFESFSEDELDSDDEVLISSTESDTTSENEEEEEEEKHTPINHIRNLSSLKAQWLSHTAAPHIKSPEELEKERKDKEEKERIERERIEQKQREKEERRRIRQEKRDSIRREKERLELERLEKARREQEEAEEEQRKQEEWERKMVERDRLDEEERQRKLKEADIVDTLGVNGINFADSDMEKDESLNEEGTPAALKKIDTPGPSRWRDALALRFASYEDEELPPMMTPVGDKMDNSLTDDEKASLRKEKVDEESKSSPKITRRKLSPGKKLSIDMDESDNDDVTDEADRSLDSESISIDDNKLLDSLRLEEDEGLPDEKTSSPRRRIIPYGESPQKSFLAVDDEDYDDLGDESPMELDVGEDGDKLKDRDEMRKEGDGESEHLSEEQDNVLLPKDDSRLRNASATDSFTISTPTGSVTSLSSLNIGSAPNTMDFEVGKEEVVDIDTPVIEAYNPPGVITPSFKGELSNPSEKGSPKRVLHLDANLDADLDVGSGYDSKFAESIDEPVRTISPKYKDSNITDVRDKLSSAESSTHSTPVKVKSSFDPKSSILASDANKGVSSAEDSSPKHGNRNFNNAAVAKNNTDDNTGSESAGEFVLAMNSIQPSQIKTDTLKHKKKRTSSGSGTARIRSDKVREQKVSPKSSPKMSRTKRRLPRTPSGIDPELTLAMKKRGEYLLKVKAETPPKDEDRPRSESEPMSGSPTKDSANVSTAIDDSRTRSQSETTESFHTPPTSNVGSPTAAEKSPTTDTQMQFSSGVPKSESKSKEKKSRLSLMRRDKKDKDIKRRNAVRSSVVPDDVDVMAAGKKEPKKLFKKKSKKNKKKEAAAAAASHDELDYAGAVGGVEGAVCLLDDDSVFPEPDILEGLQSKLIPAEKIIKPAVRKLSIDPLLTGDLDESSTEEESRDVDETPPTTKSKKGKSPRRIWGKKFKVLKKSSKVEKEKRKLEEEELNEKLTRRVQKEARKQHRQQQQKRLRMAQEIQRQLQECEVKQRQLEERGIDVEKALRGEKGHVGAEAVDENSLMQQWFSLVNEKNALVRFESELMVQARELELEDRHSALEQELRQRMAVEEEKKTEADREAEKLLLEEIVEVVEQRDALVALLEEERLKIEISESSSSSSESSSEEDSREKGEKEEEREEGGP